MLLWCDLCLISTKCPIVEWRCITFIGWNLNVSASYTRSGKYTSYSYMAVSPALVFSLCWYHGLSLYTWTVKFCAKDSGVSLKISGALSQHSSLLSYTLLIKLHMLQMHWTLILCLQLRETALLGVPSLHCLQNASYGNPEQAWGLLLCFSSLREHILVLHFAWFHFLYFVQILAV